MAESIKVGDVIPAPPGRVYQAWMDSDEHGWMTGGEARIDPKVGGRYTAWDGYIEGSTLEMEPFRRIVQAWRTSEFPADAPDSRLEVHFEDTGGGTQITLIHTGIPDGQGESYRQGWVDNYFVPMKAYFASLNAA
jgi:uncharacterized protein YndB with AHSA1/START domain